MNIEPKSIHHAGIVVSDLAAAIDFYRDVFGVEPELTVLERDNPAISRIYGVEDLEMELAFLSFPNARIELLEVRRPQGGRHVPPAIDLGAGHVCIEVDDVRSACRDLIARGINVVGEPMLVEDGPAAGLVLAVFEDPDGNRIELMQPPS